MTEDPESKIKGTIEKIQAARENIRAIKGFTGGARASLNDIDTNADRAMTDLDRALPVYQHIPGGAGIGHNSTYSSLVNSGYDTANRMHEHSIGLRRASRNTVRKNLRRRLQHLGHHDSIREHDGHSPRYRKSGTEGVRGQYALAGGCQAGRKAEPYRGTRGIHGKIKSHRATTRG